MLLDDSQTARVEVAASPLPASEKTGLLVDAASQSVRGCAAYSFLQPGTGGTALAVPEERLVVGCAVGSPCCARTGEKLAGETVLSRFSKVNRKPTKRVTS